MPIDINKLYKESKDGYTTSSYSHNNINDDLLFYLGAKRKHKASDEKSSVKSEPGNNTERVGNNKEISDKTREKSQTNMQSKKEDEETIPPFFLQDPSKYGVKKYNQNRSKKEADESTQRLLKQAKDFKEKAITRIKKQEEDFQTRFADKIYPINTPAESDDIPSVSKEFPKAIANSRLKDEIQNYDQQINSSLQTIFLPDPEPVSKQKYFNDFDANKTTISPFLTNPTDKKDATVFTDDGQKVNVSTYQSYDKPFSQDVKTVYDFDSKFKKGQIDVRRNAKTSAYENSKKVSYYRNRLRQGNSLNNEELSDFTNAKMSLTTALNMSNPTIFKRHVEKLAAANEYVEQKQKENEEKFLKENPNYFGGLKLQNGAFAGQLQGPALTLAGISSLIKSAWAKSAFSDYIISANTTQAESGLGKYARALEFENMIEDTKRYINIVEDQERLKDINNNLIQLGHKRSDVQERQLRNNYIKIHEYDKELQRLKPQFDKLSARHLYWYEQPTKRIQNIVGSVGRFIFGDSFYSDYTDSEKYEVGLPSLDEDSIRKAAKEKIQLEKEAASTGGRYNMHRYKPVRTKNNDIIDDLNQQFDKIQPLKKLWYDNYQKDLQDIEDWEKGDNVFGFHARVDSFYRNQANLVQRALEREKYNSVMDTDDVNDDLINMSPFSPKTLMYGTSGLWGASNSSWYKSAASTLSKIIGIVVSTVSTGGVAPAIGIGAAATSYAADMSQSMDENNSEVIQGILSRFGKMLDENNLSSTFYEKGKKELFKKKDPIFMSLMDVVKYHNLLNKSDSGLHKLTPEEQRFIDKMNKTYKGNVPEVDVQKIYDYITKQFIAEQWSPKNSKIDRMFANSLLGADELYKNDYYATARDAAVDAFLFCVPTGKILKAVPKTWSQTFNKIHAGYEGVKNRLVAQAFGNSLTTQAVAIPLIKLAGATTTGVMSEQLEEVTQSMNSRAFVAGQYDNKTNTGFTRRIYDDVTKNLPVVWDFWLGGKLNGLSNDSELIQSMNGATLLALPNLLGISGFTHMKAAADRYSVAEQIQAIQYAKKQGDRVQLIQDQDYVKMADKQEHANAMFDAYIAGMKNKIASSKTGIVGAENGQIVDDHETESGHITVDDIEEQRKRFDKIASLAKSPYMRQLAVKHGIITEEEANLGKIQSIKNKIKGEKTYLDNDDYQTFVALQSYIEDEYNNAVQQYTDTSDPNNPNKKQLTTKYTDATDAHKNEAILTQEEKDKLYEEIIRTKEKELSKGSKDKKAFDDYRNALSEYNAALERKKEEKAESFKNKDIQIAQLAALIQIKNDYSTAFKKLTYNGYILRHIDDYIKGTAKKLGLTEEQIKEVANSEQKLIDLYSLDKQYVSKNIGNARFNILNGFGIDMINDLTKTFNDNPTLFIKQYKKAVEVDDKIEYGVIRALDERDEFRAQAQERPLVEGDEYTDLDGNRFKIVKNDNDEYVAHKLDESGNPWSDFTETTDASGNKVVQRIPREFQINRVAYHKYKLDQEKKEYEERKREEAEQQRAKESIENDTQENDTNEEVKQEEKSDNKSSFAQKIRESWRNFKQKIKSRKKKQETEEEVAEPEEEWVTAEPEEVPTNTDENNKEEKQSSEQPNENEATPKLETQESSEQQQKDEYDGLDEVPTDGKPHKLSFENRFITPVPIKGVVYAFFSKPWKNPWKRSEKDKQADAYTNKYVNELRDAQSRKKISKKLPEGFRIVHDEKEDTYQIVYIGQKNREDYRHNETLRIYIENKENAGYFELVRDFDPKTGKPNGEYSVHFKPSEGSRDMFSDEERKLLFDALVANIPEGGIVTTHGTLTKGGIHGLNRFLEDYKFEKVIKNGKVQYNKGYETITDDEGNEKDIPYNIPKYRKPKSKPKVTTPEGNTVEPTEKQLDVLSKLQEKQKKDDTAVRWKRDPNDKESSGSVVRTALNYFIRLERQIHPFNRLHAILEAHKTVSIQKMQRIGDIAQKLQDILDNTDPLPKNTTVQEHYKEYIDAVMKLRDKKLQELAEQFGEGSLAYIFHSSGLDFTGYFVNEDIIKNSPQQIAEILERDIPGRSVIAGTIIDEICREFFAGNAVENKPDYRMDDKTFSQFIEKLKEIKKSFDDRGWILDTTPYVWHTRLDNGKYVAGETDMLAITPDGKIVVLDFKTTIKSVKPKIGYLEESIVEDEEEESSSERYVFVDDESEIPEQYRTEEYKQKHPYVYRSDYETATFGDQNTTQVQQYSEQLTAYSMMIEKELDVAVDDMQLIVMQLQHHGIDKDGKESKLELDKIDNVEDIRILSLTKDDIPGVPEAIAATKKSLSQKAEVLTLQEAVETKKELTDLKNELVKKRGKIDKENPIYKQATSVITRLTKFLTELEPYTKKSQKGKIHRENTDEIKKLKERYQQLKETYDELVEQVEAQIESEKKGIGRSGTINKVFGPLITGKKPSKHTEEKGINENTRKKTNEYIPEEDAEPEELTEEDKKYWWQFNVMAGLNGHIQEGKFKEAILKLFGFDYKQGRNSVTLQPDFITDSQIYLSVIEDPKKKGAYTVKARTLYKGKWYDYVNKNGEHIGFLVNMGFEKEDGNPSKMSKNLKIKLRYLLQQQAVLAENGIETSIVVTEATRSNGTYVKSSASQLLIDLNTFLGENNEKIHQLIQGDRSLLGIAKMGPDGRVGIYSLSEDGNDMGVSYETLSEEKEIEDFTEIKEGESRIWDDEDAADTEENNDDYGEPTNKGLIPGTLFFLHKMHFNEDGENSTRTIPIPLIPAKLMDEEIYEILDIVSKGKQYLSEEAQITVRYKDGTSDKVSIGITNGQILNMLVRFGGQSFQQENKFVFTYLNDLSDEQLKEIGITNRRNLGNKLIITDMSKSTGEFIVVNPNDSQDLKRLRDNLKLCYMYVNRYSALRHNLNGERDSYSGNPYLKIYNAVTKAKKDVETVVLSGRDDVNTKTYKLQVDIDDLSISDKSKALSGAGWMVKRGIIRTEVIGLENPFVSISDAELVDNESHEIIKPANVSEQKPSKKEQDEAPVDNGRGDSIFGDESDPGEAPSSFFDDSSIWDEPGSSEESDNEEDSNEGAKDNGIVQDEPGNNEEEDVKTSSSTNKEIEKIRKANTRHARGRKRNKTISKEERISANKKRVQKRLTRIFGERLGKLEWFTGVIEKTVHGDVIGRMMSDVIQLSETDYVEGVEYHEAFHRVWNIIIPTSIRHRIEKHIQKKYGITNRVDIDETVADLYMFVHNNVNEKANAHSNIIVKAFTTFKEYVSQLSKLKDWQLATLFLTTDIGAVRLFGPNKKSIQEFESYNGVRNMTIFDKKGNRVSIESVSDFSGKKIFDEILNSLFREITADEKYNIGTIGQNAERLNDATKLSSIKMLHSTGIFAEQSKAEGMSPWFKVISGQYLQKDVQLTDLDMKVLINIMPDDLLDKYTDEFYEKYGEDVVDNMSDAEFYSKRNEFIKEEENKKTKPEQLIGAQRIMNEMFSKWDSVQGHLEDKIAQNGVRSKVEKEQEQEEVFSLVGESMAYIMSNSYDHSRIEEMSEQVRFMLSTIPDERFATQEDVDNGTVKSLTNADGSRVTISNRTPNVRLRRYLPLKQVSTQLLVACHECETVQEMLDVMYNLGKQNPMFNRIYKRFKSYVENQYVKRKDGSVVVYVYDKNKKTGRVLNQDEYTEEIDENGVVVYKDKEGNTINGAQPLVNYDNESLVTQMFQYLRCAQKQFDMVYIQNKRDESGNKSDRGVDISIRSTSSTWASTLLPKQWFRHFRTNQALFYVDEKGKMKFLYGAKKRLGDSIKNIIAIQQALSKNTLSTIQIVGYRKPFNPATDDGLDAVTTSFVDALNTLGIDITKDEFIYFCQYVAGTPDKYDVHTLRKIFTKNDITYAIGPFIQDLENIQKNLLGSTVKFENVFGQDKKGSISSKKRISPVGEYLFSDSSFVKKLAEAKVLQNRLTKDLSTDGPGNTKRYTMTQLNEVEQNCEDINKGWVEYDAANKKLIGKGSRILAQMIQYAGVCFVDSVRNGVPHIVGSLLAKQLYTSDKTGVRPEGLGKIQIIDDGGVRTEDSKVGGTSYQDQTDREACISKMSLLQKGYVLFGTLSDKASNFVIKGIRTLGFDYNTRDGITTGMIPIICKDSPWIYNFKDPYGTNTEAIDQLIDYARCEYEAIKRNKERLDSGKLSAVQKVENFFSGTKNSVHFGVMNVVYEFNEDGTFKCEHRLDDPNDVDGNIATAEKYFFGENVSDEQRRRSVAYAVQQLAQDQLNLLEELGIIERDAKGRYVNIGLDSSAIEKLAEVYKNKIEKISKQLKDKHSIKKDSHYYEHCAICAYVADIQMKSIQSEEETERYFTGLPQFFKWKYANGKLSDRYSDQSKRHGGAGSTGNVNRRDLKGMPKTYKCAEFKDEEMVSEFGDTLHHAFVLDGLEHALFNKFVDEGMDRDEAADKIFNKHSYSEQEMRQLLGENISNLVDETAKQKIDPYISKSFYASDGGAYITPKMTENLLRMRGVFTEKVAAAFAVLDGSLEFRKKKLFFGRVKGEDKNKYDMTAGQAYRIIQEALIGSQKYSAYGIRMLGRVTENDKDEVPIHYYNKFALFPVFPQIATGKWSTILEKMEEQGVDMLLSDQAVKVGSAGGVELGNLQDIQNVKFNTYDQDYVHIRRQMNTDPHEAKDRPIGTQTIKVALQAIKTYLEYRILDGTNGTNETSVIKGDQLVQQIMTCINRLSDIGLHNFQNKFYKDGIFDIEKFSDFLRKQLSDRDANANLLDAIIVENGSTKLDLETTSSTSWIESIIASILNKEAVDVNTPGSAYYQRSVYGHEGKSIIGLTMYNGKSLKTLNEKGCMDSVCSIDYFDNIFEAGYRAGTISRKDTQTFAQRKKWLLDHNIIGENANPSTIGYRIPTQAQSSIHSLRFVDVLDVVRDTIILPKDFVSVTGSDFDIDKLYLFSPNFNAKTLNYHFTEEEDETKSLQNTLVFSYMAALNSCGSMQDVEQEDGTTKQVYIPGHSFADSYGAIDKDTELSKSILEEIEGSSSRVWRPFEHGSLTYQLAQRSAFLGGKEGIGSFALHNNSQVLTQLYGVKFRENTPDGRNTFLSILHATDLSKSTTRYGYTLDNEGNKTILYGQTKILSWLSGLINAHVDVAKDPWIIRLNVKKYTWNTLNLLVRTGFDKNAYGFIDQPIVNEMANIAASNQGEFLNDPTKSANKNTKDDCLDLIKELFDNKKDKVIRYDQLQNDLSSEEEQRIAYIIRDLFCIDEEGNFNSKFTVMENGANVEKEGNILFDILKNPNAYKNPDGKRNVFNLKNDSDLLYYIPSQDMYLTPLQVQYYVFVAYNHFEKYAQGLSDLVNCSKIDTKKQGKNYTQQQAYLDKYNDFKHANLDQNDPKGMFQPEGFDRMFSYDECYIDHKTQSVIPEYQKLLSNFSLQATKGFSEIFYYISSEIGLYGTNQEGAKKVVTAIYSLIKSGFFYGEDGYISKQLGTSPDSLLIGKRSVATKLSIVQNAIRSDNMLYVKDGKVVTDEEGKAVQIEGVYGKYGQNHKITNPLLRVLSEDVYQKNFDTESQYKFIYCDGTMLDDTENDNDLIAAWDEMLSDTETKFYMPVQGKDDVYMKEFTMADFAKELVAYAFVTSADKPGQTSFFKYVPNTWRIESGYDQYIRDVRTEFYDGNYSRFGTLEQICDEVLINNWTDSTFVKQYDLQKWRFNKEEMRKQSYMNGMMFDLPKKLITYKDRWTYAGKRREAERQIPVAFAACKQNGRPTVYYNENTGYPKFLCVNRPYSQARDHKSKILYKLVDTIEIENVTTKKGEASTFLVPIYALVQPKSIRVRSQGYSYNITQYLDDTYYQQAYTVNNQYLNDTSYLENGITKLREQINQTLDDATNIDSDEQLKEDVVDKIVMSDDVSDAVSGFTQEEVTSDVDAQKIYFRNLMVAVQSLQKEGLLTEQDVKAFNNSLLSHYGVSLGLQKQSKTDKNVKTTTGHKDYEVRVYNSKQNSFIQEELESRNMTYRPIDSRALSNTAFKKLAEKAMMSVIRKISKKAGKERKNISSTEQKYMPLYAMAYGAKDQVIIIGNVDENTNDVLGVSRYLFELTNYLNKEQSKEDASEGNRQIYVYDTKTDEWLHYDTKDNAWGVVDAPVLQKQSAIYVEQNDKAAKEKAPQIVSELLDKVIENDKKTEQEAEEIEFDSEAENTCK